MKDTDQENLEKFEKARAKLRKELADMGLRVGAVSKRETIADLESRIAALDNVIDALETRIKLG